MSSWKRNPSRAIKYKTTASGLGSLELQILGSFVSILRKYHHSLALLFYSPLGTRVWPRLSGAADPSGPPVSAPRNELGQRPAPLCPRGRGAAAGALYLRCRGKSWLEEASRRAPKRSRGVSWNAGGAAASGVRRSSSLPGVLLLSRGEDRQPYLLGFK